VKTFGGMCEHGKSMSGSRLARSLTVVLLLAVLVSQLVAFAPGHSDDHAKHCCPVCHAAHAPLLSAAPILSFHPPAVHTCWRLAPDALPSLIEAWTSGACTRGPPESIIAA